MVRYLLGIIISIFTLFSEGTHAANADWMVEYAPHIENTPLKDIIIPGTHDSATYSLEDKFGQNQDLPSKLNALKAVGVGFAITAIAKKWAMAQSRTIFQQLNDGNRYLDLRVIYRMSKNEFYMVHSLYGPSLSSVLRQIVAFASAHPKEIIIIKIGDMRHMPEEKGGGHTNLINQLRKAFEGRLVPKSFGTSVTPKKLWEQKKQIILIYDNPTEAKKYDDVWDESEYMESYWANEDNVEKLNQKLSAHLELRNKDYANKFYVVQSQLTANENTIKNGLNLTLDVPRSLEDMAKMVREKFTEQLSIWKDKNPNIIIVDFSDAQVAGEIIQLNKSEKGVPKSDKKMPDFMAELRSKMTMRVPNKN
ncbi:MAG: hypothetical protein FJX71_06465 [Alphaproteobacteria bacterium]|nr:hypothetical protein [Alphaproteobacteria bacterium]